MQNYSVKRLQNEMKSITSQMNLLLVEDDVLIRTQIKKLLLKFFQNVDEAGDGAAALTLYKKREYEIVLTDITMPNMNGIELARAIKDLSSSQIVLVLSAESQSSRFIELINIGIDGFIPKPLKIEQLLEVLLAKAHIINDLKMKKYYSDMLDEANEQLRMSNVALESALAKCAPIFEARSGMSQEYLSAEDFLEKYAIEQEFLNDELSLLEEEFNLLILSMQSQSSGKSMQKLLEILEAYVRIAKELEFFYSFGQKGEAILKELVKRSDARLTLKTLLPHLTRLFDELEDFRKEIFEYKSGINLHLLMQNLLESLTQIHSTLVVISAKE